MSNVGKKLKVHYVGTLDDGEKFDSSVDRGEPIEFTCGAGQMIPGFDKAVEDMDINETKNVHIPAAEAYGEHDPNNVVQIPLANVPNADQITAGQTLYFSGPGGQPIPAKVLEKAEDHMVIDANPPMAGKNLNFEITLVEVCS